MNDTQTLVASIRAWLAAILLVLLVGGLAGRTSSMSEIDRASDFYRHPNSDIVQGFARKIISNTDNPVVAIYQFLSANWIHGAPEGWQSDIDLIEDYESSGEFHGKCFADAVLTSSSLQSLDIPARIIHGSFYMTAQGQQKMSCPPPTAEFEIHLWTEAYVDGKWVPIGTDNFYSAFGIIDFNNMLMSVFPGRCYDFGEIIIVDKINANAGGWFGFERLIYDNANIYCISVNECFQ